MRTERKAVTLIVGAFLALFVLIAVVACNTKGGGTTYYPHDTSHGYYDVHHHYHYYPKYGNGRVRVKPAPKPYKPGYSKPKSKGFGGFGGSRSTRRR